MEEIWNPRDYLKEVSYERARLSAGLLKIELTRFFPKLIELWKPFFISLGIKEPEVSYQILLDSAGIDDFQGFISYFEVNSARGYFAVDSDSLNLISKALVHEKVLEDAGQLLLSYLLRRFFVSLEKTWSAKTKLKVAYFDQASETNIRVSATIKLQLYIEGKIAKINIGIPLSLVEIFNNAAVDLSKDSLDIGSDISIELFGVYIAPDSLLDYLRTGSSYKVPTQFSDLVNLYANGRPWAQGVLRTCQDKFAIEITNLKPVKVENVPGKTRISVQLDKGISGHDLKSKSTGSIILTETRLNSFLSLFVSGEKIGLAKLSIDSQNCPTLKPFTK